MAIRTQKMALLLSLILTLSIQGCATAGAILSGMGEGLQGASQDRAQTQQSRLIHCNTTDMGGYMASTDCQ